MDKIPINKKILIIEDDIQFSTRLAEYIQQLGANVFQAYDGEMGQQLITENEYDLILTDLTLPLLSGEEMIKRVKQQGNRTPIIVITARTNLSHVAQLMRLGIEDLLLKPIIDLSEIRVVILEVLFPAMYSSELDEEGELQNEWQYLSHSPEASLELLTQLQLPLKQQIAGCELNYSQLTDKAHCGLVFDAAELSQEELAFYVLDTRINQSYGVMVALLLRSILNEFIQNNTQRLPVLNQVLNQLRVLIRTSGIRGQFPLTIGYYNRRSRMLVVSSAGLSCRIVSSGVTTAIKPGGILGTQSWTDSQQHTLNVDAFEYLVSGKGEKIVIRLSPLSGE